ncbi:MAG TPA: aldo/keto reductase [bacterium]|nr:aldo/keto reductase [bacterium]HPP11321.1 aldo/keto reductase [bacterium]
MKKLKWGILSTGRIAGVFARGLQHSQRGELLAVGSRTQEQAERFQREFNVPRAYRSYESLLTDPEVEAIYIATPHPAHAEWAIKAMRAGKHVLCEKPLTVNHAEAMAVVETAIENRVFLMEAFMYRCHPQTIKVVQLVKEKAIGEVRMIQATFSFQAGFNPESRLFKNSLAGGGILDVGCYPVSMSRLVAAVALGQESCEPTEVYGVAHLGTTGVDEWAAAVLKFPGDILAQVATGVNLTQDNSVRIYGSAGNIHIPWPWIPSREGGTTSIILTRTGQQPETIPITTQQWLYGLEADTFARSVEKGKAIFPAMSWQDTLENMKTLDRWRAAVGLEYEFERINFCVPTVDREPLRVKEPNPMTYGQIPGLEKKVSHLVMGVDNQRTLPHASVMFDDFFRRGGNTFDTAYIYGGGDCERVLGRWVANRGLRDQVVIITKGAHTPFCAPEYVTSQLKESLERLSMDYVDIYLLHRDNPKIPAGEFVDVLNEHLRAGRIKVFGASNWSLQRVEEANTYARSRGLTGFSVLSNNFSLARMVNPVWAGCIAASDPESRAWLQKTQIPLLAWSSQARGFFTERARPDDLSDQSLVNSWYSPDNFERQARAKKLASELGVETINIALAYVLCQPFPVFALIGPRTLEETRIAMKALEIKLTPGQLRWLNLEE